MSLSDRERAEGFHLTRMIAVTTFTTGVAIARTALGGLSHLPIPSKAD
jgi:hypothetical protein